jgi:hypothetical protein
LIPSLVADFSTGICCKSVENLQLVRVKDISFQHGKCCCGCCATITIHASDETDPELFIKGLPGSEEIYKQIRNAMTEVHGRAKLELS